MKAAKPNPSGVSCAPPVCTCTQFRAVEPGAGEGGGLERAKRFFANWPAGSRVQADHDIHYLCEDVDGCLPAGSLGTVVRRAMVGLYVVRWDAMPAFELATSADAFVDALLAAPAEPQS